MTEADDLKEAIPATQHVPEAKQLSEEGRVRRASGLASSGLVVRGVVRDQSGQPIPGVNIILKGSATGTVTNAEGRYSIEVEEKDQVLEYSFIGFVSQEQPVDELKKGTLDVKLKEDVTQLSEVVVTGYGVKLDNSEPVVRLAEPIGGRKAYDTYLEEKKVYPQQALENKVEGRVVIEFTVGISGALSDFQVIRKLGYGCEDEVIRLVREGPAWKPTYVDNEAVESLVRIRTRFSLPGK